MPGVKIAGCGNLRATLAFSFMAMFAFLVTAFLVSTMTATHRIATKHWMSV